MCSLCCASLNEIWILEKYKDKDLLQLHFIFLRKIFADSTLDGLSRLKLQWKAEKDQIHNHNSTSAKVQIHSNW
jgi:hypothetical protein